MRSPCGGKDISSQWPIKQFQRQGAGKESPAVADKESPAVADNEQIPTNSDYEDDAGETMSQASSQRTPRASGAHSIAGTSIAGDSDYANTGRVSESECSDMLR